MRKLSLTSQIVLVVFSIIILCCTVFSVLLFLKVDSNAKTETVDRLDIYTNVIMSNKWVDPGEQIKNIKDMDIACIEGNFSVVGYNISYVSPNLLSFISEQEKKDVVMKTFMSLNGHDKLKSNKNETIYYSYRTDDRGSFIILITDSGYINSKRQTITFQVISIFTIILLLGIIIIILWSKGLLKRIHLIQSHIDNLANNNYKISYLDGGEDEIADLSRSIEQMRIQIEKNENTKQEMLQNVSHDFKTPIAVIKSYAESIDDGLSDPNTSKVIISQANKLKSKVNKLLQYNKLEYLDNSKEFENVNMKEVIIEVVSTYKFQTNINIELNLDDVYFTGYRENFYTVVDNILDNAKRYANTTIKITLKHSELIIYNDGDHIDEQFLNGMFKPYEKGSKGQFGLGMSIVKKTLDFFDMRISVRNESVGVSFIISKK